MDFHFRFAVFQLVGETLRLPWQLAALANGDKPDAEAIGDRRPEEKSTSVDADDFSDFLSGAIGHKAIDGSAEKAAVAENGRDIFEQDPRLRKIRHVAHGSAQSIGLFHQFPKEISAARAVSTI